ncbi:DUF1788 domain-containing protein [Marispirochaeta sp.]|uniref:DUF1788 domain-containing protein n=1 Tax=Marispirochaeta sp. TaxID=2038653 RepID=UPI0029C6774C|nr:DUF1788 domain-containing protein [Marispirochaeta sp.]
MSISQEFDRLFTILQHKKFLNMEGLGNEVPFFVHAYDIKHQNEVYPAIHRLRKRLSVEAGVRTELVGLYDMVLEIIQESHDLEDMFQYEAEATKTELMDTFNSLVNPEEIQKYFAGKTGVDSYDIIMIHQIGEVYPYLRTHDLLNQLQSTITTMPLVVFFPGEYVMSKEFGFNLNLFGRLPGPYYRAFRLDDYFARGGIDG